METDYFNRLFLPNLSKICLFFPIDFTCNIDEIIFLMIYLGLFFFF